MNTPNSIHKDIRFIKKQVGLSYTQYVSYRVLSKKIRNPNNPQALQAFIFVSSVRTKSASLMIKFKQRVMMSASMMR